MENRTTIRKQTEDFITVTDLWHICVAHWPWFVTSLLLCLGAAFYYLTITPNQYTRQAAILVKKENISQSTARTRDDEVLSDVSMVQQQTNVPDVQRQLVSLEVLTEVALRLKMANSEAQALKVAQRLSHQLKVTMEGEKSSILNLSVVNNSPYVAERILSTTVQVFNEKWLADKNKIAANTSAFIQDRLTVLEQDLGLVDDSISSFKARNRITDLDRISDLYLQQQSASDAQILTLSNQKSMAVYILALLQDPDSQNQLLPTNSGINNSVAESQINQYNNLILQLKNSMYNTSTQNPLIIKQESDLNDIRKNIVATINNHVKALDIQLNAYRSVSGMASSKITQNPTQAKQLLSVEREQKVKESLYLYLLQKKEETEIGATYTSFITEMIDQPHGSDAPTSPNTRNVLFLAVLASLVVPTVILFMRENLDSSVRDKYDVERRSTLSLIGEIPYYYFERDRNKKKKKTNKKNTLFSGFNYWHKKENYSPFVVQPGRQDIVNEAFRMIRTQLEFMTAKQGAKNVYVVTSSFEGSGKTFVSLNLVLALAIKGKRVLLIDGDLRHASATHYCNCIGMGVADYLAGNEDNLQNLIVPASDALSTEAGETMERMSSLYILPVGTVPPNPTELLAGDRLGQMIDELRPQFDFIIIDCPPMEALADTGIILSYADRTLFVMRAGLFDRKRVEDLDIDVQNGKYKNMSLILNAIKVGGRYGYRYGSHYGSRYGSGYGGYGYGGYGGYGKNYYYGYGYGRTKKENPQKRRIRAIAYFIICAIVCVGIYYGVGYFLSDKKAPKTKNEIPSTTVPARDRIEIPTDTVQEVPDSEPLDLESVRPDLVQPKEAPPETVIPEPTEVPTVEPDPETESEPVVEPEAKPVKDPAPAKAASKREAVKPGRVVSSQFKTKEEAEAKLRALRGDSSKSNWKVRQK